MCFRGVGYRVERLATKAEGLRLCFDLKGALLSAMAERIDANHLQEEAEGHRWEAESVVTDRAHSNEPRNYDRSEGEPREKAIAALM